MTKIRAKSSRAVYALSGKRRWPARKVNQSQLAAALGGDGNRPVSVPLVSSWESRTNPTVPPASRIQDIATFFASPRSFDGTGLAAC